ncbi:MAG: NAD(P)/FAD-dependent oxidoreductase, partial [Kordiimonas sp.]
PSLNNDIVGAMHFTETGHVANPYSVSHAFETYLRKSGATILKEEVTDIKYTDDDVTVYSGNRETSADLTIIAAGAFSKKLASQCNIKAPLETERGYHIHMADIQADFTMPIASYERKIIMTPMSDGLRATGIVEFGGLNMPPRNKNFDTIRHHVAGLVPDFDTQNASTWMGFRPSLPDHLPAIGFTDPQKRIMCAYGHQHLGLTLAGVTGKLVNKLVTGEAPDIDLSHFDPNRFS